MSDTDLIRTFKAQGDTGVLYKVLVSRSKDDPGALRYALRDGSPVLAAEDGLYRIEASGEVLTPRG